METQAVRSQFDQARHGAIHLDETVGAGPATSFADLYARHRDAVFRLVRRHARHDDEAADLAAGAFERAFRRFDTYDPQRGPVLPWLLRIARNHAIDASRRQRPVVSLEVVRDRSDPSLDTDPEGRVLDGEATAALRACLGRLPRLQQEALALRYGTGLTSRQIGDVIGKSESATQKLITRARTRLKEDLDEAPF